MRIGIIGAGAMAAALGGGWAAAGHEVAIAARSTDAAQALAERISESRDPAVRRLDTGRGAGTVATHEGRLTQLDPSSEPVEPAPQRADETGVQPDTSSAAGGRPVARITEQSGDSGSVAPTPVRAGPIGLTIEWAEVVLMAVPVGALAELLRAHGTALDGKVVIDCTNAFLPDESAPDGTTAFVLSEDAVAERIAAGAPKAHVVKAFNLLAAEVWAGTDRVFDGARLAVPLCGDDPAAMRTVAALAEDLALQPFPAGGLHRAKYLEATSVFAVGLWFAGADARAMLPPLSAAFAVED
ncbi:hypothetical protein NN3_08710 [Nocardia neocaledoniensis NBRC 108232]|uniref:Coenzyme F420-dependent NADP oxidoreductase-like protein n=1 Tax=Nocardia neocaledoniensis TaxID=236511 RepID=A0A317NFA7_9NOCA|nr:NAD(P)-binding domain-containing protein [Nocardia neocaledoniensis]PWV73613.1 coenzyme F420-dependent NADP oxidoreductase-like protein [Nocardia neocaledoniensis]GEM29864.1 hypothetical protein NN3_08710 [Nocardia neocaledoniensis NBRC 108232]